MKSLISPSIRRLSRQPPASRHLIRSMSISSQAAPVVWCYVGKRNLEEAVTTSGVPIELHWEPYFLDASTPKEGRDLQEYLMAKYGRAAIERFQSANNPLDKAGVRVGIQFNKERRVINTLDGHRAMEWCKAQSPDSADGLMEKLFYAYFVEAKNLCDQDVLVDVCVSAGLDGDAVRAMLLTDSYKAEVISKDEQMKGMRVSGVPFFIIENQNGGRPTAFSGAQPAEAIAEALEKAQRV